MRKTATKIALILAFLIAGTAIAEVAESFVARSENGNVILEWTSKDESGVSYYIIDRKGYGSSYAEIARINAKGDNKDYQYVDAAAYKATDALYTYRLRVNNNGAFWKEVQVTHSSVSNIKRTWGSIKDMFR